MNYSTTAVLHNPLYRFSAYKTTDLNWNAELLFANEQVYTCLFRDWSSFSASWSLFTRSLSFGWSQKIWKERLQRIYKNQCKSIPRAWFIVAFDPVDKRLLSLLHLITVDRSHMNERNDSYFSRNEQNSVESWKGKLQTDLVLSWNTIISC